jgi:hypothetical protein
MAVAIDVRPNLDALAHDPLHGKATAVDEWVNLFNVESAGCGALDSLGGFVHGDAIDVEKASHFVCGKGDVPNIYTKPFNGHWFPGNGGDARELDTAILLSYLENFATSQPLRANGVPNGPLQNS